MLYHYVAGTEWWCPDQNLRSKLNGNDSTDDDDDDDNDDDNDDDDDFRLILMV